MVKIFHTSIVCGCQSELNRQTVQIQQEKQIPAALAVKLASEQLIREVEQEKRTVGFEMIRCRIAREQDDLSDRDAALYLKCIQDGVRSLRRLDLKIRTIQQLANGRI